MRRIRTLFFAFLLLPLIDVAGQDPYGSIEGTIKDPQGAVVQNATVTVRNIATNASRNVVTNDSGQYRILQLQPGNYEVKVAATNFKQSILESVQVQVGQIAAADISLEIGGAAETVTVTPDSEARVERSDNTVSGVVNTRQIENLPLNGRNFLDLAQLQPGTERVDGGSFDPTKANFTGISIGGQAGRSTQISVDGGSVVDNVVGTTVQNFSQEIIQEFQIGIVELRVCRRELRRAVRSMSSRVREATTFNGNAFIFARDDALAAFPALNRLDAFNGIPVEARARRRVPFDRQQFGGTFGGPILKDKLFFFGSYERNNQDGSSIYNPLRAPSFAGFSPNPFDETLFTTKIDWVINDRASSYFRYSFNDNASVGPFPLGSGILPRESANGIFTSNDQVITNRAHNFVGGLDLSVRCEHQQQLRRELQPFRQRYRRRHGPGVPEIRINPEQDWRSGTNAVTPQDTPQRRFQLQDDLTWIRGNHTFSFGGNYERTSIGGTFTFANPVALQAVLDRREWRSGSFQYRSGFHERVRAGHLDGNR